MSSPGGRASSAPLLGKQPEPTIFELSSPGREGTTVVRQTSAEHRIPEALLRTTPLALPEVSERDLVAHYSRLAHRQYAVDLGTYPLGSCTMKYNPKAADRAAQDPGFVLAHPEAPESLVQGWLELMWHLERALCEITGMARGSLQPPAGAAGELTGLLIAGKYQRERGRRAELVVIPDSAHGTNPASVTTAGMQTVTVASTPEGLVDFKALKKVVEAEGEKIAAMMLTNPNTLGLFEEEIVEICKLIHEAGGLMYYDGANLNAIMGITKPGEMGFDIVHLNLHKTFATPHGGGGPGAGPVLVSEHLVDYLPGPLVQKGEEGCFLIQPPRSIGRVHAFHGNALVFVRALLYILINGKEGLKKVSQLAVLNANWLRRRLESFIDPASPKPVLHEAVFSLARLKKETGVRAIDICKRLLDKGFHAPTVNFPLLIEEALMIEPTETESPQSLEAFAQALEECVKEARELGKDFMSKAPYNTPVSRVDEALAARQLRVSY